MARLFLMITATFWTPKISFGSFSTTYFPLAAAEGPPLYELSP